MRAYFKKCQKKFELKTLLYKDLRDLRKKLSKKIEKSVDRARKLRYYKRVPERGERESATLGWLRTLKIL